MPAFNDLFRPGKLVQISPKRAPKKKTPAQEWGERGCKPCPLFRKHRLLQRVIGLERVTGKRIAVFAQSPGRVENQKRLELVGDTGVFLWKQLGKVGVSRDQCDTQNVCRCWPIDVRDGDMMARNTPTERELYHCSIYNEQALEKMRGKAEVYLILGDIAAKQLLGKAYKKDRPVFWHEPWKAYVVCAVHPAHLLRIGGESAGYKYYEFMERMRVVASVIEHPGRFGFVLRRGYKSLRTPAGVRKYLRYLRATGDPVAVDIEDADIDGKRRVLMLSLAHGRFDKAHRWRGESRTIILDHPENDAPAEARAEILRELKTFLEDASIEKTMHHGTYDARRLRQLHKMRVRGYHYDTQYASFIRFPYRRSHALDEMALSYCPEFVDYKGLVAEAFTAPRGFADVPLKKLIPYNCADAELTARVRAITSVGTPPVPAALVKVYTNCAFVTERMERTGPVLDMKYAAKVDAVLPSRISALKDKLCAIAGDPKFNPRASQQVAKLLYEKLKLPRLNDKKPNSTDEETLQVLAEQTKNPTPKLVLEYRSFATMKSTYVDGYIKCAKQNGGELRSKWFLTGAISGRLRSGGKSKGEKNVVNLQNIHGKAILKNMLVSDVDWELVNDVDSNAYQDVQAFCAPDYSQIEIRILADMAEDELLIKQFNSGVDIHCLVGAALTGWDPQKIKEDEAIRRMIKGIHFGIVYGIRESNVTKYLVAKGVPRSVARKAPHYYRAYFATYKGVARFIERQRAMAERKGWVETLFGFRRYLGAWDDARMTYWGNQAINTPIQGSAHTLLLIAMALLHVKPKTYSALQNLLMEVHDALVFRAPTSDLPTVFAQSKQLLEHQVPAYIESEFGKKLAVPLLAEAKAGYRYGCMIDYAGEPVDEFVKKWRVKNSKFESELMTEYGIAA